MKSKSKTTVIDGFNGDYFFLSNYYPCQVTYSDLTYRNSEAAFHAQKDLNRSREFTDLNPAEAKKLGRSVHLRPDWEQVKDQIMRDILYSKFSQNKELKEKLLQTKDALLIEDNFWHDTYWGVCNGEGENKLGQLLMQVREQLKEQETQSCK